MADRLSALDVSFLYLDTPTTPMHIGGLATFAPGLDYPRLFGLVEARIGLVPRFRQRIRWVPGQLAGPVWVDDPDFDLGYHLRRSVLPPPGSSQQLLDLVAAVQAGHLDRGRPLWEMYVVEGLAGGGGAIITKIHHALADGIGALDVGRAILDRTPRPHEVPGQPWQPQPAPDGATLVADAVIDALRRPGAVLDALRAGVYDGRAWPDRAAAAAQGLLDAVQVTARPAPASPLNVSIGVQRRFATARSPLDQYQQVRARHGGTVNDVVLAAVTGALRGWLLGRDAAARSAAAALPGTSIVRAMVPVSVRAAGAGPGAGGNRVSSYFVDLPVGEPDPVRRLQRVRETMQAHKDARQSAGIDAVVALSGWLPPPLHAFAARAASELSRRVFNVVVSNVPGPQFPLYTASAQLLEVFPVVPLAKGQAVTIGATSYNGSIYYGLTGDRDAMPDLDLLATSIEQSLAELVETAL